MKLVLKRTVLQETFTEGRLYVDGTYFCDTIEDKVRDLNHNGRFDGDEVKIYGETAIPYGIYKITLDVQSPKYKNKSAYRFCDGYVPRLLNVPSFEGILIHIGNSAEDSAGCILVGRKCGSGRISNSTSTFTKLYAELSRAHNRKEPISIEIV